MRFLFKGKKLFNKLAQCGHLHGLYETVGNETSTQAHLTKSSA